MQSTKRSAWGEGLILNIVSNVICLLVGGIVAYLKHEGSEWVSPLLFGAIAWVLSAGIFLIVRLWRNIPQRQTRVTENNLPLILRGWLDDIGLKVLTAKSEETYFKYIVTTEGDWVITILRHKNTPEYLTYTGYFKDEKQNFSNFTDSEKIEARLAIRLELTRAVVGYTSQDLLEGFTLFKRIPITPHLSIEDVSRTLWEVEAALASVFIVGAKFLAKKKSGTLFLIGENDGTSVS
jgi:hypothetical protein